MSQPTPEFQIQFLRNLQRLLAEGRFTATYKFALLLSLADIAVEKGDDSGNALVIATSTIAEKFVQYYWRQSVPYVCRGGTTSRVLQQNTDRQAKVISVLSDAQQSWCSSLAAARRDKRAWSSLLSKVDGVVRGMPLNRLQTVGESDLEFLYANPGREKSIELNPGVAYCLRQFHRLIVDLVRGAWVRFVRTMNQNQDVLGTTTDLYEFLFGSERTATTDVVPVLTEIQHGNCFYCQKSLQRAQSHVDHFIPWARYPSDLGHNFVLAHDKCNAAKADHVAAARHLDVWVERNDRYGGELDLAFRDRGVLHDLSTTLRITDWTYSQVSMAHGLTWEQGRTMVALPNGWERELWAMIAKAA